MTRVHALTPGPPSGASSAASEFGPALRIRRLRPARLSGSYKPALLDVGLLGLTIVLGGQFFNWNTALAAGLVPAATAFFLISTAYVVLLFSLAEVASVFPFAGGGYAISRKTLGFFGGFLVGAIDALQFIAYTSASVLTLARLVVSSVPKAAGLEPLMWLAFYFSAVLLQSRSHALFWRSNAVLALGSLAILLVFCFGAMAKCDIRKYTVGVIDMNSLEPLERPSFATMVRVLPFCAWFYVGADAVVLIADHVHEPRTVVPRAQRRSIVLLVATAVITFFVTVALPEDMVRTARELAPLTFGFTLFTELSPAQATWLSLPATYATAFGFAWAYGRLIAALAASGLLPRWLAAQIQQQVRRNQGLSSRTALGTGSLLSFLICLIVHFADRDPRELTHVCMGLAFLSYIAQTLGFLTLRRSRGSGAALAKSPFRSPFGAVGACLSLLVWLAGLVSVLGYQERPEFVELSVLGSVLIALAVYYRVYARHHQLFSADERSFLSRNARLERLREETDRDLRSAMSGIWSERSQRWSRGRRMS